MNALKKKINTILLSWHWLMSMKWGARCKELVESGHPLLSREVICANLKVSRHTSKILSLERQTGRNFVGSSQFDLSSEASSKKIRRRKKRAARRTA